MWIRKSALPALAFAICLHGGGAIAGAGLLYTEFAEPQTHSLFPTRCPSAANVSEILARGSAAMQQGNYQEAIAVLRWPGIVECAPQVSLLLAAAYEGNGDRNAAQQVLGEAHDRWPGQNSIATSLARVYLAAGQTTKAGQALDHFSPTPETTNRELEMATVVLLADHELVRARETAKAAYSRDPSLQTLLLLANALQLEGRYKDVIALLEEKRTLFSQSAAFLVTIAESEFDEKIFDAALADLTRAVEIEPKLYQAHYLRGNALMNSNDVDSAIAEYRKAIDLAPGQPRTYFQLALALRAKQDEPAEQSALQKLLVIDPQYAMAHSELGRILINQDRLSEAVVHLKAAIEQNPNAEQAYYLLAKVYDRLGESEKSAALAKLLASVRRANHRHGQTTAGATPDSDLGGVR